MTTAVPTALVVVAEDGRRVPLEIEPEPLAVGGDAAIHPVRGDATRVAKLYHDPAAEPRRRAKLDAMLAAPPEGRVAEHDGRRVVQLAWPEALLERADEPVAEDGPPVGPPAGLVLPRVDLADAALLELLLSPRARRSAGLPEGYRFRVAAARNLAAAVASLHAAGHHVVDLKPANVHVYRETGFVAVLDCDGFSVAGPDDERFPAHQYTDGYIAPEALRASARPEDLGEAHDRFALAVVVFQLLNGGLHPFQGVPRTGADVPATNGERVAAGLYPYGDDGRLTPPPSSRYDAFDPTTRAFFDRAFDGPPDQRPTAEAWRDHLSVLLAGTLRPCDRDPDHARYGDGPCVVCRPEPPSGPAPVREPFPASRARTGKASQPTTSTPTWKPPAATYAPNSYVRPVGTRSFGGCVLLLLAGVLVVCLVVWLIVGAASPRDFPMGLGSAVEYGNLKDTERAVRLADDLDQGLDAGPPSTRPDDFRSYYAPLNDALGYPGWDWNRYYPLDHLQPGLRKHRDMAYLHLAARRRRAMEMAVLLRGGALADGYQDGRTPLMLAAANAGTPVALPSGVADLVLRAGRALSRDADVYLQTARSRRGPRPDTVASAGLDAAISRLGRVPPYRHNEDYESMGAMPGQKAVFELRRNAAVVDLLLRYGASPNARDEWNRTALAYAASVGNEITVRQLLDAGADPDAADLAGVTPLMIAADRAVSPISDQTSAGVVVALLAAGADPDAADQAGRTAADYVGERPASRSTKRVLFEAPDTTALDRSLTLGLLRAASQARAAGLPPHVAELAAPAPVLAPPPAADIGDGGMRFGFDPDTLGLSAWKLEAWADAGPDSAVAVSCEGVPSQRIEAEAWASRGGGFGAYHPERSFYTGRVWSVHFSGWETSSLDWPYRTGKRELSDCLRRVQNVLSEEPVDGGGTRYRLYDLRGVPDRWPRMSVTIDVTGTARRPTYR